MEKNNLFGALLTAALVTVSGAALAMGPQTGTDSGTRGAATGGMMTQATPGAEPKAMPPSATGKPSAMSPATPSTAAAQPALPPEAVVGKEVTNAEGDNIGKVTKIVGDQVIVSVGGFLGIGTHDVALTWSQLTATGSGDDMKLQTTLTKDELKNMPEYKE